MPEGRPLLATRRRREGKDDLLWAFYFSFTDATAYTAWRTLIGATTSYQDLNDPSDSLDAIAAVLVSRLDTHRQEALAALKLSLRGHSELAARREQALAETLEAERGRLSAAVLQRGLFDRKAERHLAAQNAVLEEALLKCRIRLSEIAATTQIVVEPGQLAFVLVRR